MPAKPLSRQRQWQLKQVRLGRCSVCGQLRPPELTMRCRVHQDAWNRYQREGAAKEQRVGDEVI